MAVPKPGNVAELAAVDGLQDRRDVEVRDELVRADFDGDGALGVGAQGHARHLPVGRFFLQAAGVGDDAGGA